MKRTTAFLLLLVALTAISSIQPALSEDQAATKANMRRARQAAKQQQKVSKKMAKKQKKAIKKYDKAQRKQAKKARRSGI